VYTTGLIIGTSAPWGAWDSRKAQKKNAKFEPSGKADRSHPFMKMIARSVQCFGMRIAKTGTSPTLRAGVTERFDNA
jgi:hypothetical protein